MVDVILCRDWAGYSRGKCLLSVKQGNKTCHCSTRTRPDLRAKMGKIRSWINENDRTFLLKKVNGSWMVMLLEGRWLRYLLITIRPNRHCMTAITSGSKTMTNFFTVLRIGCTFRWFIESAPRFITVSGKGAPTRCSFARRFTFASQANIEPSDQEIRFERRFRGFESVRCSLLGTAAVYCRLQWLQIFQRWVRRWV